MIKKAIKSTPKGSALNTEIQKALEDIRPLLALHAGDLKFVKFEKGTVYVKLLGTCENCFLSQMTLKAGIEEMLRERIPEVELVEAV